jgi:hypothetical protein
MAASGAGSAAAADVALPQHRILGMAAAVNLHMQTHTAGVAHSSIGSYSCCYSSDAGSCSLCSAKRELGQWQLDQQAATHMLGQHMTRLSMVCCAASKMPYGPTVAS